MNINLNYREETKNQPTNSELTLDYILYAVSQKYADGLEGQLRRICGRIQRKLDEAIEKKKNSVEFETAEIEFIKKAFNEAKFPPHLAKFVIMLEDEIDKIK